MNQPASQLFKTLKKRVCLQIISLSENQANLSDNEANLSDNQANL
jgi:hypothetical protein